MSEDQFRKTVGEIEIDQIEADAKARAAFQARFPDAKPLPPPGAEAPPLAKAGAKEKKLCPLRLIGDHNIETCTCIEARCAWWYPAPSLKKLGWCVILDIGFLATQAEK